MTGILVKPYMTFIAAICCAIFFTGCSVDGNENVSAKSLDSISDKPAAGFANTYWKLTELNGNPAELGNGQKELHLITGSKDKQVHGFSGCNRYSGSYTLSGDQLTFGQMISTRMACLDDKNQETAYLQALTNVRRFAIEADTLKLYDDQNRLILQFVAVYLR